MPDIIPIIKTVGLIGIFLIVFAESGLFFGFFLPGDSLLFSAGLIASFGFFNIYILILVCILASIAGDNVGYWTGKRFGPKLFTKDKGFLFKKKRIEDAENFYKKHGRYTIIIARFIPVIRTFAPIVAGIGKMDYKIFFIYNVVGGIIWPVSLIYLGYFLGQIIPDSEKYILPVVGLIILISIFPLVFKYMSSMFKNKN